MRRATNKKIKQEPSIHVAWTALAKIRVQSTRKTLKEVSISVDYLGKGHKLVVALRSVIQEIKNIEKLLDKTYGEK